MPSELETLIVERGDGVVTVTMNRPARKNAANGTMWRELMATCEDVAADRHDRVMVLTGAGDAFCSGADLGDPADVAFHDQGLELAWHFRSLLGLDRRVPRGEAVSEPLACEHPRKRRSPTARAQNASSMTSTWPAVIETTSNRTSTRDLPDAGVNSDSHRDARRRIRRCLAASTDSAPVPNRSLERVLTSQKTTVLPRRTMRSTSPSRRRQFRSRTSYPWPSYHRAADSSPSAPRARRGSGPSPPVGVERPGTSPLKDPSRGAARCSRRGTSGSAPRGRSGQAGTCPRPMRPGD